MTTFNDKLLHISHKNNSLLCVGLDIDTQKIPSYVIDQSNNPYVEFNKAIIKHTKDLVCAYKLNLAFYEALGETGGVVLRSTLAAIPKDMVIILDGKRNDIGNTAKKYAISLYDVLGADAVTINPYLGSDGIIPFISYKDKCSFILCRTSNPSAIEFQDLLFQKKPLYEHVAMKTNEWNKIGKCGVVVGATYPKELQVIRKIVKDETPFLIPGIGKQGGDLEKTVMYGTNSDGELAIINSSRGIIYAGSDENYVDDIRNAAEKLRDAINLYRRKN
jgi:orotidine-5'-phosphate decarboxylase